MAKKPSEQTVYRDLECSLTNEELDKKRDELANAVLEEQDLREEKSSMLRTLNERIRGLQSQAEDLSEEVRSRSEVRPVECHRVFDAEAQRVALILADTDEVVEVRDMEPEEVEISQGEEAFAPDPDVRAKVLAFVGRREEEEQEADPDDEGSGDEQATEDFDLTQVKGVGEKLALRIAEEGFGTLDALRGAVPDDLAAIPGVTVALAERILLYVEERYPWSESEEEWDAEDDRDEGDADADEEPEDVLGDVFD